MVKTAVHQTVESVDCRASKMLKSQFYHQRAVQSWSPTSIPMSPLPLLSKMQIRIVTTTKIEVISIS